MKITTTPIDNQLNGLSDLEVKNQISKYGFNELPASNKKNLFYIFFEIMK